MDLKAEGQKPSPIFFGTGLSRTGGAAISQAPLDYCVTKPTEPIFNLPAVMVALIAAFCLVHAGRVYLLSPEADTLFVYEFGFVPARYGSSLLARDAWPGGAGAELWTFVTYAFLHGDIVHLGMNTVWFLPFGTAVARRFGSLRFLGFFAATAIGGALIHLLTHAGEPNPMIGASAAISGCMAGATRFAFQSGGPLDAWRRHDPESYRVPAQSLRAAFSDVRILSFLAVWFGLNLLFGAGGLMAGASQPVAWQAHVGGFLVGLLLFAVFDPIAGRTDPGEPLR
jgi:membrane associated rhomboid family serine protease